nr:cullin-1-like isoform X2 [Erigeron canadensis]
MKKKLTLEEGFGLLKQGIAKAMMILDGYPTSALFTCEDYMKLYDCVYDMCVQPPPSQYSAELYEMFKRALEESITSRVLPALKDKRHIFVLDELCNMWAKYKVMAKCLGGFFLYLDRHFVEDRKASSLNDISVLCFHDMVFRKLYHEILEAAVFLTEEERAAKGVYRDVLKNVSTFFVEIGSGKMHYYVSFETAVIESAANYYNLMFANWLLRFSPMEIIVKAQCQMNQEKERASEFLHQTSQEKLLLVVHDQLLGQTALSQASKLQEKQKTDYQEVLLQCAGLNLGEGS